MATKPRKPPNPALDLFGEIPVTWSEVFLWIEKIAPRWHNSRRIYWYIDNFHVIDKIKHAKRSGTFEQLTQSSR